MSAARQAGVEPCEMKIAPAKLGMVDGWGWVGRWGVTVCLSRRLLSTHTLPRDKHSRDSVLIMLHLYQDTQMCTLCQFTFRSTNRTTNEDKHQVVQ